MTPAARTHARRRRGTAIVYLTISMVVLFGFASLAVDFGRVEVAKTQLQTAADAAARSGALALKNVLYGTSAAAASAAASAAANTADGSAVVLDQTADVDLGVWTAATKTFVVVTDPTIANAVRVTARRVASRGTGVPLLFLKALGRPTYDVQAVAVCQVTAAAQVTMNIPATCNPYLAGQPPGVSASNGNPHNSPDYSAGTLGKPSSSPVQAGLPVAGGQTFTFDGVNGSAAHDPSGPPVSADGGGGTAINTAGSEHGISTLYAPFNCILGVYLNDSVPGSAAAPPVLDFSTAASQNFTSLSPKLNQTFFIGDGRTSGGAIQQFVAPAGATRLFLADMDSYEWNNNIGSFTITVHGPAHVTTVH